ncbi:hypothetical protein PGH07_02085 [Sulfurovum sp. zt1-1]|uniref:Uncharacterized protein n=1 Tax=Sulfurovum zhangzhouensis TaxID=3019067 RepID=A0ABT7QVV1_9BACT|nr:hypothetical protein [Sulfurovum zhangzhouensis]MDM5270964.1 hypothetical protein [Sulfurovum zhangzhouensis]
MSKLFTIHYACESLIPKRSSYVTAISVCEITTKMCTSFSMMDAQKTLGTQSTPQELEAYLLKVFFEFVSNHSDATWIHWHMHSLLYGFGVLQERFEMIWDQQAPKITSTLNLPDNIFKEIQHYCRRYPKMYQLFQDNRMIDQAILPGKDEAASFSKAEYTKIKYSSQAKAKALAMIYDKFQDKSLVISCSRLDKMLWVAGVLICFLAVVYLYIKGSMKWSWG